MAIESSQNQLEMYSGSKDGIVKIWKIHPDDNAEEDSQDPKSMVMTEVGQV